MTIQTVTGPKQPEDLGIILAHEHVGIDLVEKRSQDDPNGHVYNIPSAEFSEEQYIKEAAAARFSGNATLVSLSNQCMGRDLELMRRVSEEANINVIAPTGYYTRHTSPQIDSAEELAKQFITELEVGIGETGIRAGVIGEIASDSSIPSKYEKNLFKASAIAHLETGAPITTHTHGGQYSFWQLTYLQSFGVPADRIIIGHLDDPIYLHDGKAPDLDLLVRLADMGTYIALDCVGVTDYGHWVGRPEPTDRDRAWAISKLVERGYEDQIILSHDLSRPQDFKVNGGPGYAHIESKFLPWLVHFDVEEKVSRKFINDNPMRWLTGNN